MATIGLYDLDFFHGRAFTISLPLMHAYSKLMKEGHQVIMMKPGEKTGRFNSILYFKDKPDLIIPKSVVLDNEKGKFFGYGFYGYSGINEDTKTFVPSFAPYDLFSNKIKNKTLYNSIKANSVIDWREKDFLLTKADATYTYVLDRDFLSEPDWEELFDHFDNKINFVRTVMPPSKYDLTEVDKFLTKPYGKATQIVVPATVDKDKLLHYASHDGVCFNLDTSDTDGVFFHIFISKVVSEKKIRFYNYGLNEKQNDFLRWAGAGRVSFAEFMGENFKDTDYLNCRYRALLKQNPLTISYEDICEEYLVK